MSDLINIGKKKIVVYGYGVRGTHIVGCLISAGCAIDFIIDGALEKQGKRIQVKNKSIEICSADILKGKADIFYVLVSPEKNDEIIQLLEEMGYKKGVDYAHVTVGYVQSFFRKNLISLIANKCDYYRKEKSCKIIYAFNPTVGDIHNPSELESVLKNYRYIISDRISWLKENPPHVREAHQTLPEYSTEYIECIFTNGNQVRTSTGELVQEEWQSPFVKVIGGMRLTTDVPSVFDKTIHVFGSSITYGLGVEDKYTFPSCLQRIINEADNRYRVLNYGVIGLPLHEYVKKIENADIRENDIIICMIARMAGTEIKELLDDYDCTIIDLVDYFQRPHNYGEVFWDGSHFNYKGNIATADIIYKRVFKEKLVCEELRNNENEEQISEIVTNKDFIQYLLELNKYKIENTDGQVIGGIVVNANPFHNGHLHLIKLAATMVDHLYIFVVENDVSEFSFADRIDLVRKGVKDIENVTILPSGKFIISNITFPDYFDKDNLMHSTIDPSLDVDIFGRYIAKELGITIRFVGEEPFDNVTRQYNEVMKSKLPQFGIKVLEIPRKFCEGNVISAKRIRTFMQKGEMEEIKKIVPPSTYELICRQSNVAQGE